MEGTRSIPEQAKGISLRLLFVAGIFLLSLLLFYFIADEMVLENENHLDIVIFNKLQYVTNPGITKLMIAATFFGSHYFLLPAYIVLIVYFLFFKKNHPLSWTITAVGITSTVILYSLKHVFQRQRPLDPLMEKLNGFSFPSGHSFSAFTFFGLMIYVVWKLKINLAWRWIASIVFFFSACLIAFSRVYLHMHFASDVIAGFCLCVIWLGISFWVIERIEKRYAT
jgi:undecaprenyl-diphosphatase